MKQAICGFLLGLLCSALFAIVFTKQEATPPKSSANNSSAKAAKTTDHTTQENSDSGSPSPISRLTNPQNSGGGFEALADIYSLDLPTLRELIDSREIKMLNPFDSRHRVLMETLFERYYQLAPKEAIKAMDDINGYLKNNAVSGLFREWAKSNLEEALNYATNLPDKQTKDTALGQILETLSDTDPEEAFALCQKHQLRWGNWSILMNWAKTDPQAAIEKSKALTNDRDWIRTTLMKNWAYSDPDQARSYLESLTDKGARKNLGAGFIQALLENDPDQAFVLINSLTDPQEKTEALGLYYQEMVKTDPEMIAQKFLDNGFAKIGSYSVSSFLSEYADQNPEGAKDFFQAITDPVIKDKAISGLISSLSEKDPKAAMEFAFTQAPSENLRNAMWYLGKKIGSTEPAAGIQSVLKQERNGINGQLLGGIYYQWAQSDFNAALEGLQLLEADDLPDVDAYRTIAREYADNPEEAVKWIETIRTGADKHNATFQLVHEWSQHQPDEASNWVNSLPGGGHRDSAVRSLVSTFSKAEPETALEWASSISDKANRLELLKRTFKSWQKRERSPALEWLQKTDHITEEQRKAWQTP